MRFLSRFTETEYHTLIQYLSSHSLRDRERIRFTAVRLNSERIPISELCRIFEVSRNTVQSWLNRYETGGFEGLLDRPSPDVVSSLSGVDATTISEAVSLYPQNLTQVVGYLATAHNVHTNENILRRYLKKKYRWKRVRRSLKHKRKEGTYEVCAEELAQLRLQAQEGAIELWFCDETSVGLNPNSLYAWHAPDQTLTLPATRTKASSILGFLRLDNQNEMYEFDDSLNSELFIKTIDNFIEQRVTYNPLCKTMICLDNYSVHKANIVQEKQKEWEKKNVFLYFLAPYCSELNPIEILWRFLKHQWLAPKDYRDKETLKKAVTDILRNLGSEYKIDFKT